MGILKQEKDKKNQIGIVILYINNFEILKEKGPVKRCVHRV